jgi:phospholipid-binding lipoprotein MlaA
MPELAAASATIVPAVPAPAAPAAALEEPTPAARSESRSSTEPAAAEPAGAASPAAAAPDPGADQNDIVVTAPRGAAPGDPLEKVNAISFAATQAVDEAVIGPAARAYAEAVPRPVRSGLRNFLHNLHEPVVFLNFMLQIKPGKAVETLGRFTINSTIGVAGLFDVAKRRPFNLPRRPNGFADTLGFYGVKPGPFLFLPLIGPTTPRDLVGLVVDRLVLPVSIGNLPPSVGRSFKSFKRLTAPTGFLKELDHRAEFDEQLQHLRATADPYAARREFYLQRRQAEIDNLRGRHFGASRTACGLADAAIDPLAAPGPHAPAPNPDEPARPPVRVGGSLFDCPTTVPEKKVGTAR